MLQETHLKDSEIKECTAIRKVKVRITNKVNQTDYGTIDMIEVNLQKIGFSKELIIENKKENQKLKKLLVEVINEDKNDAYTNKI